MYEKSPITRARSVPTASEVTDANQQVSVAFHEDYKQFVLRYGGGMVGPYPLFGLRPVEVMDHKHWSVVDITRHYRAMGIPSSDKWGIISEDHAGNPIGMDNEGAIWIYDHDCNGTSLLARSFEQYIREHALKLPSGSWIN